MKKLIFIAVIALASCAKKNVYPYGIEGAWKIRQAEVVFENTAYIKFEDGNTYQYTSAKRWYKIGEYTINDSTMKFGLLTVYWKFEGDKLTFRDLNYKFNYPSGGEPKDVLER